MRLTIASIGFKVACRPSHTFSHTNFSVAGTLMYTYSRYALGFRMIANIYLLTVPSCPVRSNLQLLYFIQYYDYGPLAHTVYHVSERQTVHPPF